MRPGFRYEALPMRIVFGRAVREVLGAEVTSLGLHRLLVICSPEQRAVGEALADALGEHAAGLLAEAEMHVPAELALRARDLAIELGADGCIAAGGGSAIGLGKAIALRHGLPIIAVPTTYAGSEMTPIWGLTDNGVKTTGRELRVLPRSVIYDPRLTLSLPARLSVTSGLNAIAHAVEALYAPDTNPIIALQAEEGVRALAAALPKIVASGDDLHARSEALYGAWLCGACLGATTMSLHHKLCHILGGTLDLPHAETHAVVLPHVLAYNAPAAREAIGSLSRALRAPDPALALWESAREMSAPRSLRELGMSASDIARVADLAVTNEYANPRTVTRRGVARLLQAAWEGDPPGVAQH